MGHLLSEVGTDFLVIHESQFWDIFHICIKFLVYELEYCDHTPCFCIQTQHGWLLQTFLGRMILKMLILSSLVRT